MKIKNPKENEEKYFSHEEYHKSKNFARMTVKEDLKLKFLLPSSMDSNMTTISF